MNTPQEYIDTFHKMSIMLEVTDDEHNQVLKFTRGLYPSLQEELELLDIRSLEKAFKFSLVMEHRMQEWHLSTQPTPESTPTTGSPS